MGVKVEKPRCNGQWTEARYRSFIISTLRRSSSRWGPRNACKKAARHHEKLPSPTTGRLVYHCRCAGCGGLFPETTCSVDHINPVIDPKVGFQDWDTYIERMYCEADGFQVLCEDCHSTKTKEERDIATERKRRERAVQT